MLNEANILNLIQDWVNRGLVAPEHQTVLVTDVRRLQHNVASSTVQADTAPPVRRINPLVVTIAIICGLLGLALLAQLAANWQEIPRLVRVFVLCCTLVALYGGAGWRRHKIGAEDAVAHGLAALGTVVYGVSLLLVSQMFHIGGTVTNWLFLWMAGAFLTALAFSSRPVLIVTTVLAGIWGGCLVTSLEAGKAFAPLTDYIWQYPAVLLLLFLPARRWRCTTARVVLFLLAVMWGLAVLGQVTATWHELSKGLRLILVLVVLLTLYGWMGWFRRKGGAESRKVQVFAIFGNLFYGVSLLLVGQMFSLGGTIPDWLLLWWLGTFAMMLALSSRVLLFFSLILTACLGQNLWISHGVLPVSMVHLGLFLVTVLLLAVGAWQLRSQWRLSVTDDRSEISSVLLSLLCGGILLAGVSLAGGGLVLLAGHGLVQGWLLPWILCSLLLAVMMSSRGALGLTMVLVVMWGRSLILENGALLPFWDYAGQWLPILLLLLLPSLRWKSPSLLLLWQIVFLGWLDTLLVLTDFGHGDRLMPFQIGGIVALHLAAAMALKLLPDRWNDLTQGGRRLHFWIAAALTFFYALTNSLSKGDFLGRAIAEIPLILTVLLSAAVLAMAYGLFVLWRRHLSRLSLALWGLPLFFAAVLTFTPVIQTLLPPTALATSEVIYSWLTALLVLGLLIVLMLGEAVKNQRSTMVLCSLLLIVTCIALYMAWSFSSSALLFLLVGGCLFAGMKMVRRARG